MKTMNSFSKATNIYDKKLSTLYYISGYVAFKEKNGVKPYEDFPELPKKGEFHVVNYHFP